MKKAQEVITKLFPSSTMLGLGLGLGWGRWFGVGGDDWGLDISKNKILKQLFFRFFFYLSFALGSCGYT